MFNYTRLKYNLILKIVVFRVIIVIHLDNYTLFHKYRHHYKAICMYCCRLLWSLMFTSILVLVALPFFILNALQKNNISQSLLHKLQPFIFKSTIGLHCNAECRHEYAGNNLVDVIAENIIHLNYT